MENSRLHHFLCHRMACIENRWVALRDQDEKVVLGTFYHTTITYTPNILHLTLMRRNSLTINALLSVRYYKIHLHATYTTCTLPHGTSRGGMTSRHRGAKMSVAPTDFSTSLCRIIYCIRTNQLRGSGEGCVRCVQGSVRYFEIILHS